MPPPPSQSARPIRRRKIPSEIAQLEATNSRLEKLAIQRKNDQKDKVLEIPQEVLVAPDFVLSNFRPIKIAELVKLVEAEGVENALRMRKHELLSALAKAHSGKGAKIIVNGTLEITTEGYGFLRYADQSYVAGPGDVYVSHQQIRRFLLRTGDVVTGEVRCPQENERYFSLSRLEEINDTDANDRNRKRIFFETLTPLFPTEQICLERNMRAEENLTGRIIDMFSPIGKGQRGLLVASPKSGKTVILQHIAHAIEENNPDVYLIVLLVDERPEEVTEMRRSVRGEVISSTFDEAASRHVQVAELVMEKAKRMVEMSKDVVILLDSITRLARAYNTMQPASGRVLSGGVDAQALQRPKRFFGAARNVEEGGSLTIIATALIETGSKMDEVIYEEFKGTGNMELHLDRRIAEHRIYPSILVDKSGTRREDLLIDANILKNIWILRKALSIMDDEKKIEFLLDKLRQSKTNSEFFKNMKN